MRFLWRRDPRVANQEWMFAVLGAYLGMFGRVALASSECPSNGMWPRNLRCVQRQDECRESIYNNNRT